LHNSIQTLRRDTIYEANGNRVLEDTNVLFATIILELCERNSLNLFEISTSFILQTFEIKFIRI